MLAFGILGLFGVGIAMSMSGGDDIADEDMQTGETETNEVPPPNLDAISDLLGSDDDAGVPVDGGGDPYAGPNDAPQQYDTTLRNNLIMDYVPIGEVDEQTSTLLSEFLDTLDPEQDIDAAADEYRAFVTGLGIEIIDITDALAVEDQPDAEVDRPPMGEEFRDPLTIAEEQAAAEAEAREPVNLVTVTGANDAEVPDESILSERDPTADDSEPAFVVTAPEGANEIEVGFDAEHTFMIEFNDQTTTVNAGLNSTIEGPEGAAVITDTTQEDDDGDVFNVRTLTRDFAGSADITINVEDAHIGTHAAQIDLTNAADALRFDFSGDVTGNLHLIFEDTEIGTPVDSVVVSRAYVVQTSDAVSQFSSAQLQELISGEGAGNGDGTLVAEIFLGRDALFVNGNEIIIDDYINDDPLITSNVGWASVIAADADDTTEGEDTVGDPTGNDTGDDDFFDIFNGIGLNPGFFGI